MNEKLKNRHSMFGISIKNEFLLQIRLLEENIQKLFRFLVGFPELFKRPDFLLEDKLMSCDQMSERDHSNFVDEMVAELFEELEMDEMKV